MASIQSVVILGSGNLAWHFCHAFKSTSISIQQIFSKNFEHAKLLANEFGLSFTSNLEELEETHAYIFALSDSAISEILFQRKWHNKLLIHCAGSVPMNVFEKHSDNFGVLYPLQSFTKGKPVKFNEIPFLIEANTPENEQKIHELAQLFSKKVLKINSDERCKIHLSAVFASNYVNYMIGIASQFLEKEKINPDILYPLINETIRKAQEIGPFQAQTGPARRNNQDILKKHQRMLESNPDWQKLYTFVAEKITSFYQQHDGKF